MTTEQVAAVTSIAAVAAAAPPPVNAFPPQGAPQPGNIAAGGGVTPSVALTVGYCNQHFISKSVFI